MPNNEILVTEFAATGLSVNTGGVEGAIDMLTREIAARLRENETTVVWMLDASLSLEDRRNALADRIEAVYAQLGNTGDVDAKHLRSAVATFGEGVDLLTPEAVSDVEPLVELIRNVKPDESGKENVFTALKVVGREMLPERTRQRRTLMFVILTDERGDDTDDLENVISQFKRYGVPVYCVGNAAPFGRDRGYVTYLWKEGDRQFRLPLPVDAGPETVLPERIRLGFWAPGGEVENERLSSGYGPYALTRLCVETGGMYLVADDTNHKTFEPELMRSYGPDYRPIADYTRDVMANGAKRALIEAARDSRATEIPQPQLVFPAVDDNRLRREITEAQKPIAVIGYRLQALQAKLEAGLPDRPESPGAALAGRVRPRSGPRLRPAGPGLGLQHRARRDEERPEGVRAGEQQRMASGRRPGVRRRRRGQEAHPPERGTALPRDRRAPRHPLGPARGAGTGRAARLGVEGTEQRNLAGDRQRGHAGGGPADVRP